MKKLLILLVLVIMAGCGQGGAPSQSPAPTQVDMTPQGAVAEYFPFKENTVYKYSGATPYSEQESYAVFIKDGKMQRRTRIMDFISTEVLEVKEGELRLAYADAISNGFEDFMDKEDLSIVILKEPLVLNNSWERAFVANDADAGRFGGKSTITAVNVPVKTAAGEFTALEVTTEFETGNSNVDYYVKGVGLVKSVYTSYLKDGDKAPVKTDIESELSEIIEDSPLSVDITAFFPDALVEDLESEKSVMEVKTNQGILPALEILFKNTGADAHTSVLTENTKINFVQVNREDGKVHMDLSKEFTEELNAGAGYESLIQQSLANTLVEFYRGAYLYLTVEGVEYTGNH